MNTGKAADAHGIQAKYIQAAAEELIPILTQIFTTVFNQRHVPRVMKSGCKVSIPKKKKDPFIPNNHRGITITNTIGKHLNTSWP